MMRSALNRIDAHSESTVMIGDRMDTDVIAGLEAGLRTILVLTGSTKAEQVTTFPTGRPGSSTRSRTWWPWSPNSRRARTRSCRPTEGGRGISCML